jgi:hypothetical protein
MSINTELTTGKSCQHPSKNEGSPPATSCTLQAVTETYRQHTETSLTDILFPGTQLRYPECEE